MKNSKLFMLAILVGSVAILPASNIKAADFEGNEEAWLSRCSVAQETSEGAQECAEFKTYYAKQSGSLQSQINDVSEQIESVKKDIESMAKLINEQEELITTIEKKIDLNDATIRTLDGQIADLDVKIKEKMSSIKQRDELIMNRMRDEQENTGTNMSLEVVMGARDLLDMIRKIDGLQRINESDQQEIDKLKLEKEELNLQKEEQERLKQDVEDTRAENVENKASAENLKKQQETLLDEYRKQEVVYEEKLRSVEADMSALESNISSINTSVAGSFDFAGDSGSFVRPVNGPRTGGTWNYANGSAHLGADIGVGVGTPIYAPANGIVLYAANQFSSTGGALGNFQGWPAGAGNSVHMITQVDGVTYAISFFHMAKEGFMVSPGQSVSAGEVIGRTGHSGNSLAPHCHIEVVNLGTMSLESAISRFQNSADFSWGTGWGDPALSNICSVSGPPCRERPEEVFGY